MAVFSCVERRDVVVIAIFARKGVDTAMLLFLCKKGHVRNTMYQTKSEKILGQKYRMLSLIYCPLDPP